MLGIDQILDGANRRPFFKPYFNQAINTLSPTADTRINNLFMQSQNLNRGKLTIWEVIEAILKEGEQAGLETEDITTLVKALEDDLDLIANQEDLQQ
jgi:hypothetical protein